MEAALLMATREDFLREVQDQMEDPVAAQDQDPVADSQIQMEATSKR